MLFEKRLSASERCKGVKTAPAGIEMKSEVVVYEGVGHGFCVSRLMLRTRKSCNNVLQQKFRL